MMRTNVSRVSGPVALVVALLALLVALGGTSYAAVQLAKGSVGTAQLKGNAVTSAKVKNGSLKPGDFGAGQLPTGATGATGAQGLQGNAGARGPSDAYQANSDGFQSTKTVSLSLPAGNYLVIARVDLFNQVNGDTSACTLTSPGDTGHSDYAFIAVSTGQEDNGHLQTILTLSAPSTAVLACSSIDINSTFGRVKLDAIAVAAVH